MKKQIRGRSVSTLGAALASALLISTVGAVAPAAAHTSCNGGGSKGSGWTIAYANNCTTAQSRITRYFSSSPHNYYGSWSSNQSYVSNYNGSNAGNHVRFNLHGEIDSWKRA